MLIGAAVLMLGVGAGAGFFAGGMMKDDPAVADGAEAEAVEEEEDEEPEKKDRRHSIYVTVGKLLAAVEHKGSTRYIGRKLPWATPRRSWMTPSTMC